MAAEVAARAGASVTVYDRMPSLGRKFLLAGRGGLNLTHAEAREAFLARYGAARPRLEAALEAFGPEALRQWCEELGQPTFIGTSGRVFPVAMKTSPLLRAWLRRLAQQGLQVKLKHTFQGWSADGRAIVAGPEGTQTLDADAVVLALGGASWPHLGADGAWVAPFEAKGIHAVPLAPANCGVTLAWSEIFASRNAGAPLKRIAIRIAEHQARGEAIVTRTGLEGGAIYAIASHVRMALAHAGIAAIEIDLRPDETNSSLAARLATPRGKRTLKEHLRRQLHLSPVAVALLQEVAHRDGVNLGALSPDALASLIKALPLQVTGMAGMARAISTAGGVAFDEIDDAFMLKKLPGVFVAGEMLDWEAPTGGYLLQACFATGFAAGQGVLRWLSRD